jgi:hypothetical protein
MKQDDFEAMREHNTYYPFSDRAEWELAKFLCDNLNQGQITRFLKLLWVCLNFELICTDCTNDALLGGIRNYTAAVF